MLNENPDNDFHWKNKLEGLESSPGETFNKEASWEKLHNRLQKKSSSKKAAWYWVAAACLVLAFFTPWFLSDKKEDLLVKNISGQNKKLFSSSAQSVNIKDAGAGLSSMLVVKKLAVPFIENNSKTATASLIIPKFETFKDQKQKEEYLAQKIITSAAEPIDTAVSITANLPVTKKLKVVHVNELGDPGLEFSNVAKYYERHSFQIKIINKNAFTSPSSPQGNTGFTFFKTKTAPSN